MIPHRFRLPLALLREAHYATPVVVLQSDDWGQPCARSGAELREIWPTADSDAPWLADAAEAPQDVQALAQVLRRHVDARGRAATMTLNFIVHEPDYEAIAASGFTAYMYHPIVSDGAVAAVRQAADVLPAELHGGEHVAPHAWLAALRDGLPWLRRFFDAQRMPPPGLIATLPGLGAPYLASPGADATERLRRLEAALATFRGLFGRAAQGFVAPNHAWDADVEEELARAGVRYLQAAQHQYATWPAVCAGHWVGLRSGPAAVSPLWYQARNLDFEPVVHPDAVDAAIAHACLLLQRGIPVVVNTHRINYAAAIRPRCASDALAALDRLLGRLRATRPDLLFLDSAEFDGFLRRTRRLYRQPSSHLVRDLVRACAGRPPAVRPAAAD